jgi:hypothetical protein
MSLKHVQLGTTRESASPLDRTTQQPQRLRWIVRPGNAWIEGGAFARAFDAMPREYLLPWTCWEPQGTEKGKAKPRGSKLKYTCPTCAANAWGKPGLLLRCGECDETMVSESQDDDRDDAGQSTLWAA